MPDISQGPPNGPMRIAQTSLRTGSGCAALLRMPGLAASGDDAEQLGLATPQFQELSLGPVAFHKANNNTRLMVSAAAVLALVQSFAYDSADVLFQSAAGVLIEGVFYLITNCVAAEAMDKPYCYWLTLQPPAR
ncbi:hypothetical protein GOB94_09210 [Granulicella sp. 5B5]|uniref:hypothetical protein n=1 Tax=Granulicella sp. 5B5 TaxID=1617967 RepID=UPI0015F53887|nr:hypothetical protein [Granulicella sp. 5B5]QMV18840.1 hypothetical protein GOB94_09210 [Granulicella sp. 5B5]